MAEVTAEISYTPKWWGRLAIRAAILTLRTTSYILSGRTQQRFGGWVINWIADHAYECEVR